MAARLISFIPTLTILAFSAGLFAGVDASRTVFEKRVDSVSSLTSSSQQILIGCYPGGAGGCPCPIDNYNDTGVLINVFPGYQCAYPSGACAWSDTNGQLQDVAQGNCPETVPCPASGCTCPEDLNGDAGVMVNYFTGYQCAYANGACTWDDEGVLQNTDQGNCPVSAAC